LARRAVSELIGTMLLVATVVGSGIMAERLAGGNIAVALLANTIATGAVLTALIMTFGPISGAHLNPVVTLGATFNRELAQSDAAAYLGAQILGGVTGAIGANFMFGEPLIALSRHARSGGRQVVSEIVATFGLVLIIQICAKLQLRMVAFAAGGYITAAYWFTPSTSFANPAVTLARSLTDTFTGIRPVDVPLFIVAQVIGGALATLSAAWLLRKDARIDG
jgi:glycerol uptake facilitator-like aquaporin